MSLKPIKLFSHPTGPNPWKVAMILEELEVPYESEYLEFGVLHTPVFEKYNPNGRVPAIVDPNNDDLVLWESGAIIEYLTDMYDKDHRITPSDPAAKYKAKQWLFFQVSGQGPYFGQAAWFHFFHSEKVPSARERYIKEVQRVTKVLDAALEGRQYLCGDQCTYADIAFVPWYSVPKRLDVDDTGYWEKTLAETPNFKAWYDRLLARPAIKRTEAKREALRTQK